MYTSFIMSQPVAMLVLSSSHIILRHHDPSLGTCHAAGRIFRAYQSTMCNSEIKLVFLLMLLFLWSPPPTLSAHAVCRLKGRYLIVLLTLRSFFRGNDNGSDGQDFRLELSVLLLLWFRGCRHVRSAFRLTFGMQNSPFSFSWT